ncbi:MAG: hypothetical protein ACRD21_02285 [Vicinamibacteria bacterium]
MSTAVVALLAVEAEAQPRLLTGYYQNVPLWSVESDLFPGGFTDFNRFRIGASTDFGKFSVEVAYEHVLTLRENEGGGGPFVGAVPGGGEWLELQWTIDETGHAVWQHRFDRLKLGWAPVPAVQVEVGRQAVSWATTLFLTPADPFSPFDPADPFREFRAGVDAARVRVYPGPLSEIDFVVRPTKTAVGEELTALGRGLTTWRNWEISGWAGALYDEVSGAFAASGSLGQWALRGEAVLRDSGEDLVFRGAIGVDRRFTVSERDLLLVIEYQRDGFGASDAADYPGVLESEPFLRGELQVLGRDEAALQSTYQIHPLWSLSGLVLWNLADGSALLSPGFTFSASDEATVSGGLFLGLGEEDLEGGRTLASEYGLVPATAYVSVSFFF